MNDIFAFSNTLHSIINYVMITNNILYKTYKNSGQTP